jgi:hypothetical protein
MVGAAKNVLAQSGVAASSLRYVIPHQANYRIIDAVAQRLEVEDDVVYRNVSRYGNTSAASDADEHPRTDALIHKGGQRHEDIDCAACRPTVHQ